MGISRSGPLDDPPFYSEFVLIEPARKVLSPAAALFARLLEAEARQAELIFESALQARRSMAAERAAVDRRTGGTVVRCEMGAMRIGGTCLLVRFGSHSGGDSRRSLNGMPRIDK